jgi:acyl phosphate:glycerol-3-phosphate acyltransferase
VSANFIVLAIVAYFAGSIPFGKIIGNSRGIDIQKKGSGNIGFANSYRILGKKAAVWVLIGDVGKGLVPTLIGKACGLSINWIFVIGLITIVGHIFPVWLKFKGGKGIATGLGVLLALSWPLAIIGLIVWFGVLNKTKMFSVASLSGAWAVVLASQLLPTTRELSWAILSIVILGTVLHWENILRIISHREPRSWSWK